MTTDLLPQVSGRSAGSRSGEKSNGPATSAAETIGPDAGGGVESREATPAFDGLLAALVAAATSAAGDAGGTSPVSSGKTDPGRTGAEGGANAGTNPPAGAGVLPSGKMLVLAAATLGQAVTPESGSRPGEGNGGQAGTTSADEGDDVMPGARRPEGPRAPTLAAAAMAQGKGATAGRGGDEAIGNPEPAPSASGAGAGGGVPGDVMPAQVGGAARSTPPPIAADTAARPVADTEQATGNTSRSSAAETAGAGTSAAESSSVDGTPGAHAATAPAMTPGGTTGGLELDGATLARQMTAARTSADGSPVTNHRITDQVARGLLTRGGALAGNESVTLQLEPEQLGRVEVRVVAREGRLEVTFTAETAEAGRALREGAQDLARTLGNRGEGRWQAIDVKVAEPGSDQRVRDQGSRDQGGRDGGDGDEDHESPARDQSRDQQQSDRRHDRREDA